MTISSYLKMDYEALEKEINKQNRKIENAKETIRLLKKLQVAEKAKTENGKLAFGDNTDGKL